MKSIRYAAIFLILMAFLSAACAEQAAILPDPPPPAPADTGSKSVRDSAEGDPVLYCDKTEVYAGETFTLSWNEHDAELVYMYRYFNDGEHEGMGFLDTVKTDYSQRFNAVGKYTYYLAVLESDGQWKYSNFVDVYVTADESEVCAQLAKRGMNNKWNLLFMVYKNVSLSGFSQSFGEAKLDAIRRQKNMIKWMLEKLSDGRMMVGTVDLVEVDEPITSVTNVGYSLPALSYGPGKDVDFNYIFDHKDITLVAVFAPLMGYQGQGDWLGLGGTNITVNGKKIYTVILNDAYPDDAESWTYEGITYPTISSALVHEILHCVETNARANGWSSFEGLHDNEQNGYDDVDGNYRWYKDLMRNTLDNGKYGFARQSFYVTHSSIAEGMAEGFHTDYDGITRYYVSGIPHMIDMSMIDIVIPKNTTQIDAEAFAGISGITVFIPETVQSIGSNAFESGSIIYGRKGSYAESWANLCGFMFVAVD